MGRGYGPTKKCPKCGRNICLYPDSNVFVSHGPRNWGCKGVQYIPENSSVRTVVELQKDHYGHWTATSQVTDDTPWRLIKRTMTTTVTEEVINSNA